METSKKQNSRQQYASDFKEEIIRMLNSGKKVQELSKTFGIGENVLYNWKMKSKTKVKTNEEQSSFSLNLISENEKLLEFYVSIYPDVDNRTSRFFISELKKCINNKKSDIIDINKVNFITYKGIGVNDFLEYKYEITSFDKIIEFNGNYVIKFIAKPIINGEDILTKYKQSELDLKYKNKVKK